MGQPKTVKGLTPEQINAQGGKRGLERFGEVREIDMEARTVELAFSSEVPVARWFGEEVLDHSPGAMRAERLEQGAALLINHDWDDQIGVVESVSIGDDRRGRAVVRFGRSARANEIWQDVADGIRKHVSVGYSVRKIEVEPRKGQPDLVRVTEWEPFEISLVSVPADPTVGVGRSAEIAPEEQPAKAANTDGNHRNKDTERMEHENEVQAPVAAPAIDPKAERAKGGDAERARVRSIMDMGEKYGAEDLARDAVKDGAKPEDFQRKLLDHLNASRGGKPLGASSDADIGLTDREAGDFSFVRALRALANPTDKRAQEAARFEFEASQAAAERMGKTPEGILVPADVLRRTLNTATSGSAAGDTGGFSVATDLMAQSFIDLLRNRTVAMQLGTSMGGLVGNIQIPRQASGASGYWIGEDQDAPNDGLEMDQIGMSPKTVAALSEITRRLLLQSSLDVEALVRRDLATALALTIDEAFFYGSGSTNEPRGVTRYNGINSVDFTTSAQPTFAELVEMESEIAADNADVASMAYVLNAKMRGYLKTAVKFGSGTDQTIWENGNTVNGYRTEVTNQIGNGDVIFGNFADAMIGMWGGLELNVDPYTHSAKGRLRIVAFQDVDFVLRRVESFCLGRYVAPGG
jgi:HK97 family phage major capsid protein/HK97 family phage prohead protease